nr:sugar phosphate isomerase/epimerase [Jiella flava]
MKGPGIVLAQFAGDGAPFNDLASIARWAACREHPRGQINDDPPHFARQMFDYLDFIDIYHARICAFHVKDAEFNATGRQGVYSGVQPWLKRAGRFRSFGDRQVDFAAVFSKLAEYGYDSWAGPEWECALKDAEQGASEGAPFITHHIIAVTDKAFDDCAAGVTDDAAKRRLWGITS